jgi:hypothetical protein
MKWEAPVALAGPAQGLPDTKVGAFTQALYDEAKDKGWTVISMKDDWNRIFAFEASGSRALQHGESTVQHVTRRLAEAVQCRAESLSKISAKSFIAGSVLRGAVKPKAVSPPVPRHVEPCA